MGTEHAAGRLAVGSSSEVWLQGSVSQGGNCLGATFFGPWDPCSRSEVVVENGVGRQGDQIPSLHGKVPRGRCWLGVPVAVP